MSERVEFESILGQIMRALHFLTAPTLSIDCDEDDFDAMFMREGICRGSLGYDVNFVALGYFVFPIKCVFIGLRHRHTALRHASVYDVKLSVKVSLPADLEQVLIDAWKSELFDGIDYALIGTMSMRMDNVGGGCIEAFLDYDFDGFELEGATDAMLRENYSSLIEKLRSVGLWAEFLVEFAVQQHLGNKRHLLSEQFLDLLPDILAGRMPPDPKLFTLCEMAGSLAPLRRVIQARKATAVAD